MAAIRRPDRADEWWVDFRFQHRRIRKRSPVQTRRGAEQFERTLRNDFAADAEAGRDPFEGPPPTFAEFAERWMRDYAIPRNRRSTVVSKRRILDRHLLPRFAQQHIDKIDTRAIDDLVGELRRNGLAAKTINNVLSVMHSCLGSAARWHLIRGLPSFQWVRVPEPRFRYLKVDEERALVAKCRPGFWRALILLLLHTGLRFSEAAALEWADIDFSRTVPTIRVCKGGDRGRPGPTKTGSHREVPLSAAVAAEIASLPRGSRQIFPPPGSSSSRQMDPAATNKFLHRICHRAGIEPCGWHVLRHTFATRMAAAGTSLPLLQKFLGHTTLKMTMRYVHVDQASMVAALSTIEQIFASPTPWSPDGHRPAPSKDSVPILGRVEPSIMAR